jgi:hypothetical protein
MRVLQQIETRVRLWHSWMEHVDGRCLERGLLGGDTLESKGDKGSGLVVSSGDRYQHCLCCFTRTGWSCHNQAHVARAGAIVCTDECPLVPQSA